TAVAAIARRVSLPESVVLVVVGLFGAVLFPEIRFAVTPALVLGVFIPGLVFAAAYTIDWSDLRAVLGPVIGLAVPGVVAAGAVVAARAIAWSGERTIQLATTLVLAYGTFQLAAAIGLSGILATVIAGITLGTLMRRSAASSALVAEVEDLWAVVAFTLTSL